MYTLFFEQIPLSKISMPQFYEVKIETPHSKMGSVAIGSNTVFIVLMEAVEIRQSSI